MEYEIRPFDITNASDEDWAIYFRFHCKANEELFPEEPTQDEGTTRTYMTGTTLFNDVNAYIVVRKDRPAEAIGWLRCTSIKEDAPSYPGNEDRCRIHMTVLDKYRKKGIGRKLFKMAYDHALEHNKTKLTGNLLNEASRNIIRRIGGNEALSIRVSHLNMTDVDWKLMEQWVHEGPQRSPTANLEFHLSIPDSIIEHYSDVYTEVLNQAPRDELTSGDEVFTPEKFRKYEEQTKKIGGTWLAAIAKEQDGEIMGLTDIGYNPSTPTMVFQYLTGVQEEFRGRGLGKWLKGAMLLKIRNEYPNVEVISTGNATSNKPMLAINERMGFRLIREVYAYEVELQKVKEYLS